MERLIRLIYTVHLHLHTAVIKKNPAAYLDLLSQFVVSDGGDLLIAADRPRGQCEAVSLGEGNWPFTETSETDLRTLQILKNADVMS